MSLAKTLTNRLRAGSLVVLVEESDEQLALDAAKNAAKMFAPVVSISAADPDAIQKLENQKTGQGTLIISDFLRVFGGNPVAIRLIREVALQRRENGAYSRLILIEVPGVEVPGVLRSDIEYVVNKLPDIKELLQELQDFIESHDVKLEGNGEVKYAIASAVSGMARHEAARLFARCYIEKNQKLDPAWLRKEKAARVAERLGGALTFVNTEDSPEVGGLGNLKSWLSIRKDAFGSEKAKQYGLPEPKGLLLLGVPGGGKSLTVKTVGRGWGLPTLRLDAGKLFGSLVGQSEAQTRQAIEAAEACAPCILWIDEIEKGLGGGGGLDGGTSQRVFGTLLTWLQEKTSPVFVVATANRISGLPPELLRKGRFDEIFFVDLPTREERLEIVKIHLARHGRAEAKIKAQEIADASEGFTGAELEQGVIEGLFTSYSQKREIKTEDILAAVRGTVPLSKTMADQIKELRAWATGRAKSASVTAVETGSGPEIRPRRTMAV
jgi:SpoVK/Ycf46/Vps4 family AAA+-type ATPase